MNISFLIKANGLNKYKDNNNLNYFENINYEKNNDRDNDTQKESQNKNKLYSHLGVGGAIIVTSITGFWYILSKFYNNIENNNYNNIQKDNDNINQYNNYNNIQEDNDNINQYNNYNNIQEDNDNINQYNNYNNIQEDNDNINQYNNYNNIQEDNDNINQYNNYNNIQEDNDNNINQYDNIQEDNYNNINQYDNIQEDNYINNYDIINLIINIIQNYNICDFDFNNLNDMEKQILNFLNNDQKQFIIYLKEAFLKIENNFDLIINSNEYSNNFNISKQEYEDIKLYFSLYQIMKETNEKNELHSIINEINNNFIHKDKIDNSQIEWYVKKFIKYCLKNNININLNNTILKNKINDILKSKYDKFEIIENDNTFSNIEIYVLNNLNKDIINTYYINEIYTKKMDDINFEISQLKDQNVENIKKIINQEKYKYIRKLLNDFLMYIKLNYNIDLNNISGDILNVHCYQYFENLKLLNIFIKEDLLIIKLSTDNCFISKYYKSLI